MFGTCSKTSRVCHTSNVTLLSNIVNNNLAYSRLNRKAFVITETELRLMANAAIIGDNNMPVAE